MDPATISTTLATIVGLLCNYRQEKGDREQLDHRTFVEWLEYHRHEEIKTLICDTYHLQSEVDALPIARGQPAPRLQAQQHRTNARTPTFTH